MKNIIYILLILTSGKLLSQIGIGTSTPDPSSVLDLTSTNRGLSIPNYVLTSLSPNTTTITSPATGLLIYNTGGTYATGIYFWNGSAWEKFHVVGDFDESYSLSIPIPSTTSLVSTIDTTGTLPGFIEQSNTISGSVPASVNATTGDITLPAGFYKVQVKLDGTIVGRNNAGWTGNAAYYYRTPANINAIQSYQNIAVNAVFQDSSGTNITDVQTVSNLTQGQINGYEYSFWFSLTNASNVVKLKLYYDTASTTIALPNNATAKTYEMTPQQSGLKVAFLRIR